MKKKRTIVVGASAVVLAGLAGGGVAWATAGDDAGERVTGAAADRAAKTALAHVGAGTLEGVERGDDGRSAWEVEITRPDGSTVEVQLDAGFAVLGAGSDDAGGETDGDER
jgi:hypothetical protein